MKHTQAFSLIELLVVMAVISMIIAVALPNYLGIRQRARDSKKKAELAEIKKALRMYYGDFQAYPYRGGAGTAHNDARKLGGCGTDGLQGCSVCTTADFAQGGADGCSVVYYKKVTDYTPTDGTQGYGWNYVPNATREDFCLYIPLENSGDSDIATSLSRCASVCSGVVSPNYAVCAD